MGSAARWVNGVGCDCLCVVKNIGNFSLWITKEIESRRGGAPPRTSAVRKDKMGLQGEIRCAVQDQKKKKKSDFVWIRIVLT